MMFKKNKIEEPKKEIKPEYPKYSSTMEEIYKLSPNLEIKIFIKDCKYEAISIGSGMGYNTYYNSSKEDLKKLRDFLNNNILLP